MRSSSARPKSSHPSIPEAPAAAHDAHLVALRRTSLSASVQTRSSSEEASPSPRRCTPQRTSRESDEPCSPQQYIEEEEPLDAAEQLCTPDTASEAHWSPSTRPLRRSHSFHSRQRQSLQRYQEHPYPALHASRPPIERDRISLTSLRSVSTRPRHIPFSDSLIHTADAIGACHTDSTPTPPLSSLESASQVAGDVRIAPRHLGAVDQWLTLRLEWTTDQNYSFCSRWSDRSCMLPNRVNIVGYREVRIAHETGSEVCVATAPGRKRLTTSVRHLFTRSKRGNDGKTVAGTELAVALPAPASTQRIIEGEVLFRATCCHLAVPGSRNREIPITVLTGDGTLTGWSVHPVAPEGQGSKDERSQHRWQIRRRGTRPRTGGSETGSHHRNYPRADIGGYAAFLVSENTTLSYFSIRSPQGSIYVLREVNPFWLPLQVCFSVQNFQGLRRSQTELGFFATDTLMLHLDMKRLVRTKTDMVFLVCMLEAYMAIKDEQCDGPSRRDASGRLRPRRPFLARLGARLHVPTSPRKQGSEGESRADGSPVISSQLS
ncbi:unnamed protein product [Parajaminaea phylloscopi]